jgi:hypothetical protein
VYELEYDGDCGCPCAAADAAAADEEDTLPEKDATCTGGW